MNPPLAAARHVLVVDDDADIREALAEILEGEGYRVGTAADGREGIVYLRAHPETTLVLLDLMMPVMDGFEFRAAQQREPAIAAVPVVVMTASGKLPPGSIDARAILSKPLNPSLLLDCIRHIYAAND